MLDLNTKINIIDNARQILVGKVPNPITQVDLITTAMIYKFMDDMDLEATSLGGKRMFFVGELKKYAWNNLLSATIGNNERLTLYTEALDKLPYAKQIPQLFRNIFRESSLPFKDARVLTLFLKEIDGLTYDNSETLGDAFEHLLAILGVQKEAGSFRTPRHIIDFIVEVVKPTKNDSILDPACGTAGFLISAYKHIIKTANEQKKPLSVDAIKQIAKNITGYDNDPTMQKLSLVNLYLHKFATPKVYEYDTLTYEDRWGDKFDVILANPPFMTPKGGIRPHNKFGIKANKSEVLFVDYFMEHLTLNGRAGFVVPDGIIFKDDTAYKNLRKMMVEDNYLYAVVSLPSGVFNPYSGVKTSILFFDRQLAKKTDKILFVEVKNDGFDLGAKRRPIKENDLPSALQAIQAYQKSYNKADLQLPDNCLLIEKSKIVENGNYNLTASRYKKKPQVRSSKWQMVDFFSQLLPVKYTKKILRSNYQTKGKYPIIDQSETFIAGFWDDEKDVYKVHTPVVIFGDHTRHIKYVDFDFVLGADGVKILKPNSHWNVKFFYYLIKSIELPSLGYSRHYKEFEKIKIPLPPLEVQEEIVKELDGYQAIINGSQDVVDNWKPYFAIKPNWKKVLIGEICSLMTGGTPTSTKEEYYKNGTIKWLVSGDIHQRNITDCAGRITELGLNNSNARMLPKGSVLIALNGQGITRGMVALLNTDACCNQSLVSINSNDKNKLDNRFLYYYMRSIYKEIRNITGDNQRSGLNMPLIRQISIPLPSLNEQKAIVEKIEWEEDYIRRCKEVIAYYKQKIADKIQTIWSSK